MRIRVTVFDLAGGLRAEERGGGRAEDSLSVLERLLEAKTLILIPQTFERLGERCIFGFEQNQMKHFRSVGVE